MEFPTENSKYELLYNSLTSLGNWYALNLSFNTKAVREEIAPYENEWKQYNPRKAHIARQGLSLTSLDGSFSGTPDLDSLLEYNREKGTSYDERAFRTPTVLLKEGQELRRPLEAFMPYLGRSHLIRLNEGGYFPFHRDGAGFGASKTFRLIALLNNCGAGQFCLIYDNQRLFLEEGCLYFLNTKVEHALISFGPRATFMVLNVNLEEASVQKVMENLRAK